MEKCFFKREIKEIDKISKTLGKEEKKQDKEFAKLDKMFERRWSKWA